jgi:hypothetical protein
MSPSFRINEWLALRKYSRPHWYRLKAAGNAPDTIGTGRTTRITAEADARWLEKQEREARKGKQHLAAAETQTAA